MIFISKFLIDTHGVNIYFHYMYISTKIEWACLKVEIHVCKMSPLVLWSGGMFLELWDNHCEWIETWLWLLNDLKKNCMSFFWLSLSFWNIVSATVIGYQYEFANLFVNLIHWKTPLAIQFLTVHMITFLVAHYAHEKPKPKLFSP